MTGLRTTVSCFDRLFDKALSNKYYLSIRLEPDGLFYTIYDPEDQKYIAFESALFSGVNEIYRYIGQQEILTLSFAKTICIVPSSKYTLVPSPLFIPEKAHEYFSFMHSLDKGEELRIRFLYKADARMVYSTEMVWFEIINDHFHDAEVIPATIAFAEYIMPRVRNLKAISMFINLYHDSFDLLLVDDGKLRYCNCYTYKAAEDIVYYTVFVIDQLKINVEDSKLKISGRVNSKQEVIKLFKRYIKSVDILENDPDVRKSYALENINIFSYPDLFNPRLCEL